MSSMPASTAPSRCSPECSARTSRDHPGQAERAPGIEAQRLGLAGGALLDERPVAGCHARLVPAQPVPPAVGQRVGVQDLDLSGEGPPGAPPPGRRNRVMYPMYMSSVPK